jgi:hypothetical protein
MGMRLAGKFGVTGNFHRAASTAAIAKELFEACLLKPFGGRWTPAMVKQQENCGSVDQGRQREQLIVLRLYLQENVESREFLDQLTGFEIGAGTIKRQVERDADNAPRLEGGEFVQGF